MLYFEWALVLTCIPIKKRSSDELLNPARPHSLDLTYRQIISIHSCHSREKRTNSEREICSIRHWDEEEECVFFYVSQQMLMRNSRLMEEKTTGVQISYQYDHHSWNVV